jgi:hypothetical protein
MTSTFTPDQPRAYVQKTHTHHILTRAYRLPSTAAALAANLASIKACPTTDQSQHTQSKMNSYINPWILHTRMCFGLFGGVTHETLVCVPVTCQQCDLRNLLVSPAPTAGHRRTLPHTCCVCWYSTYSCLVCACLVIFARVMCRDLGLRPAQWPRQHPSSPSHAEATPQVLCRTREMYPCERCGN